MPRLLVSLALASWAAAVPLAAGADDWVGRRVFWKESAQPRIGTKPVDPAMISYPATVSKVDGDWLWLERAWVPQSDVMTVDQALEYWTEQIERSPGSDLPHGSRAIVWCEKGEFENALADHTEALRLDPSRAATWNNRANVWDLKGEFENAVKDYTEAIRLRPSYAAAHSNRGLAHLAAGDCAAAIADCTEAIRLDPGRAHAYVVRANARFQGGDYERAVQDIETALRLDPTNAGAIDSLAWLRATCPDASYRDAAKALELAAKAGDLEGWAFPGNFDTLAAAHAEAGDFSAAVEAQQKAIALQAATPSMPGDRKAFAAALERYRAGQAFRDEPGVGKR